MNSNKGNTNMNNNRRNIVQFSANYHKTGVKVHFIDCNFSHYMQISPTERPLKFHQKTNTLGKFAGAQTYNHTLPKEYP